MSATAANGRFGFALHTARHDNWLTPPDLHATLGEFDLDPCAVPEPRPWPTACEHIAPPRDGLLEEWGGRVWCNPPYSQLRPWLNRMAEHGNGIALTFARTDTAAFAGVWRAAAIVFLYGRLYFRSVDGKEHDRASAPSVLIAYGERNADVLRQLVTSRTLRGAFISLSGAIAC